MAQEVFNEIWPEVDTFVKLNEQSKRSIPSMHPDRNASKSNNPAGANRYRFRLQREREIQSDRTTLETIHRGVLVEPSKVQHHSALRCSYSHLYSYRMNTVMHTWVSGGRATVIGDLEAVIANWADFGQQRLVLLQRKELTQAPVIGEILTGRKIEAPFLPVNLPS